ncbi:MAG: ATP-binding cassette domain-containing protein [Pseudomonadota bacterium]
MTNPASEPPVVLRADGLVFGYTKQAVFNGLSLSLSPGATWVGGDESTGKTTLLRLLAGELPAKGGALQINGVALADQAQAYRRQVFWVDPRTQAFDALTPMAYWDGVRKQYPAFSDALLADLTEGLGIAPHLPKSLYMLSTGTKRKVFVAAAFASGAAVTLLDEPFAALDKASVDVLLELLQEAAAHPSRAWLVADYVAPRGVELTASVHLGN